MEAGRQKIPPLSEPRGKGNPAEMERMWAERNFPINSQEAAQIF
jgi:hypothetical protein